jgi:two-component system response regulator YesN
MDANSLPSEIVPKLYGGRVEKAKAYMTENFHKDVTVEDIAASAHLSKFHFGRIFKQITQLTPHQYLTGLRLKHAAQLLRNSKAQIKEIGYSSGYNNAEYFSSAFKKKYRVSPVEFRMKHRRTWS